MCATLQALTLARRAQPILIHQPGSFISFFEKKTSASQTRTSQNSSAGIACGWRFYSACSSARDPRRAVGSQCIKQWPHSHLGRQSINTTRRATVCSSSCTTSTCMCAVQFAAANRCVGRGRGFLFRRSGRFTLELWVSCASSFDPPLDSRCHQLPRPLVWLSFIARRILLRSSCFCTSNSRTSCQALGPKPRLCCYSLPPMWFCASSPGALVGCTPSADLTAPYPRRSGIPADLDRIRTYRRTLSLPACPALCPDPSPVVQGRTICSTHFRNTRSHAHFADDPMSPSCALHFHRLPATATLQKSAMHLAVPQSCQLSTQLRPMPSATRPSSSDWASPVPVDASPAHA